MHIGQKIVGLDGTEYRSDLERAFCDKFLYDKYQYNYEVSYEDSSKRTCDFHLPIFDLWIEVVPYTTDLFDYRSTNVIPEKIFLKADYSDREVVKANGAKWDKEQKSWYIVKVQYDDFKSNGLKRFLPNLETGPRYINENRPEFQNFLPYYKNIQYKKQLIESRGGIFCTVHESDLTCDTLLHILQSKQLDGWKFIRIADNIKFNNHTKISRSNTVDSQAIINELIAVMKNPGISTRTITHRQKQIFVNQLCKVIHSEITKEKYPVETEKPQKPTKKKTKRVKEKLDIRSFASAAPGKKFQELKDEKNKIRVWEPRN